MQNIFQNIEQNKSMLSESAKKSAIAEIKRGEEVMKRLYTHLNPHSTDKSSDLSRKVLQSLSTALHLLVPQETNLHTSSAIQSSNNCSLSLKRKKQISNKVPTRRRKLEDSKSICMTQAPHYDGYKWRKYGEKTIQNCVYPRTYYRCTHKDDQGCLSTKKIQQQDDGKNYYDSPMFQVIYENKHSCSSTSISNVEYVFHDHRDQSSFTTLETKRSSSLCNVTIDNITDDYQDEHNSSKPDIDQNLFSELSSALKIEKDILNCDSAMEINNFHMSPNWIPYYQYESDYNHDLESLLNSFV